MSENTGTEIVGPWAVLFFFNLLGDGSFLILVKLWQPPKNLMKVENSRQALLPLKIRYLLSYWKILKVFTSLKLIHHNFSGVLIHVCQIHKYRTVKQNVSLARFEKRNAFFFGSVYFALSTVPSKNYSLPRSPKDYQLSLVAICSTCNSLDREQKVRTRNTLYPRTFNHCK